MSIVTAPRPRNRQRVGSRTRARRASNRLGGYSHDQAGTTREIVCLPSAGGSRLVIDRDAETLSDWRLVAHLAADEPPENARTVCELYLADARRSCRPLCLEDFQLTPFAGLAQHAVGAVSLDTALLDSSCHVYRVREVAMRKSFRELRWTRSRHPRQEEPFDLLTLRHVVARLEDYEPARAVTTAALAVHEHDHSVSICRLRAELECVTRSRIVLNRGLREAVAREMARGEVSMSQIALRCGRVKHDKHGNQSGETSWLRRRIGEQAEGGQDRPTPWIHTDVLALIARRGLGIAPREIEL
jgi:hypothetical protein